MTKHMTTAEKIESFREYKQGWRFGQEGVSFAEDVLIEARQLNDALTSCGFQTDAFPGTDGSIIVALYHNEHYIEFDIEPDGTVGLHYEVST